MCVCEYMCVVMCMWVQVPVKPEEGIAPPGAGAAGVCEPPGRGAGT